MFEAVLNPLAWWGLAAVSVPVIIHLINRLRYKRIHWAAMEFLLKAMQKHKRKLLLEQLILLLLRCLLILLVVLLIVRPTWFLGGEGNDAGTVHHHVFLLDDSLSMHDVDEPRQPESPSAYRHGVRLLSDLAQAHAMSGANHHWTILLWSKPAAPELGSPVGSENPVGARMTSEEATRLRGRIEESKASYYALTPLPALQQAVKHFDAAKEGRKHLHILSDFRRSTWRDSGDEFFAMLADLSKHGKVRLQFHDVSRPGRMPNGSEVPPAHGNVGITELTTKPRRGVDAATTVSNAPLRIVTPRLPFDVHVSVRNFETAEHSKLRIVLKSEGIIKAERIIDRLAGGEERKVVFNLEYGSEEPVGLKSLSAKLEEAEGRDHLSVDDVRFGSVELKAKVNVLLVDPDARNSEAASDWLYISSALTGSSRTGIQTEVITPRDLATRKNLSQYSAIYLLNIAGVGRSEGDLDEDGLRNVERYVRGGGSLAFFLGPRTNVASFNERLYQKGTGIFPVPLLLKPDPDGRKAFTYIDEEPDKDDGSVKLRFLQAHPAFPFTGEIADALSRYIHINRYFRVDPQWKPTKGSDVLVQLTNRRPLALYREEAIRLANDLGAVAGEVPEGKLQQYVGKITASVQDVETKKARKGELIDAIAGALGEPAATGFWKEKKHEELQKRYKAFLELMQTGDALVIESSVSGGAKPGRVVAFLTSGSPWPIRGQNYGWNDMAQGDLAQFFFVPMVLGLQEHLSAQTRSADLESSAMVQLQPMEFRLDKDRYNAQVEVWYQAEGDPQPSKVDTVNGERVKPLYETPVTPGVKPVEAYEWLVRINPLKGPGYYRLKFNQVAAGTPAVDTTVKSDPSLTLDTAKIPEEHPLAFNIDGRREGELTRISEEMMRDALAEGLTKGSTKTPLGEAREYVQGKNWFVLNALDAQANEAVQTRSWSDFSWVLFLFVGVLLLEQFLAMKFSHHVT